MRRQFLAATAAATALAVPAQAQSRPGDAPQVSGESHISSKQASNYEPVLTRHMHLRRERPARRHAPRVSLSPILAAIAQCESHDNPHAIGGGGAFRGKYQFDYATWASVGGHGDPAAAPEREQDMRAQLLLERAGTSPWPVCG